MLVAQNVGRICNPSLHAFASKKSRGVQRRVENPSYVAPAHGFTCSLKNFTIAGGVSATN